MPHFVYRNIGEITCKLIRMIIIDLLITYKI